MKKQPFATALSCGNLFAGLLTVLHQAYNSICFEESRRSGRKDIYRELVGFRMRSERDIHFDLHGLLERQLRFPVKQLDRERYAAIDPEIPEVLPSPDIQDLP